MPQAFDDKPSHSEAASHIDGGPDDNETDLLRIHPTITLDEGARDRLTQLVRCCDHTLKSVTRWGQQAHWLQPGPHSPRDLDQHAVTRKLGPGSTWTRDPLDRAVHTSILYLAAAAQHLAGIRSLLETGQVIFPVAPLVRAVVELCGRVHWTFAANTELHVRQRVARMVLLELDDADRARVLANDLQLRHLAKAHAQEHARLTRDRLDAMFYPSEKQTKNNRLTLCGQKLPSLTASVKTLQTPGLYAGLSAASHPTLQLVLELIDKTRLGSQPGTAAADPTASVPLSFRLPDMDYLAILVRNAALVLVQAWTMLATYSGNSVDLLDPLQDEIVAMTSRAPLSDDESETQQHPDRS